MGNLEIGDRVTTYRWLNKKRERVVNEIKDNPQDFWTCDCGVRVRYGEECVFCKNDDDDWEEEE